MSCSTRSGASSITARSNSRRPEVRLESSAERLARLRAAVAPFHNYLHNPLPAQRGVCAVCAGAVEPAYSVCFPCRQHRAAAGDQLADAIVPIAYAIEGEQHYADLVTYKSARSSDLAIGKLKQITELFIRQHLPCLQRLTGESGPHVAVVPSTRGRTGPHPVLSLLPVRPEASIITITSAGRYPADNRDFAADRFVVTPPAHGWTSGVLLVDDLWVTGARVQSAAYALKQAGAPSVAAVTVGRRVRESWTPSRPLLDASRDAQYDPDICRLCQ